MPPAIPLLPAVRPPFQASQWLKQAALLDGDEMHALFTELPPFWIVQVGRLLPEGEEILPQSVFLEFYDHYAAALKRGELPVESLLRSHFSPVWTTCLEALYRVSPEKGRTLVKVRHPVVQLQLHRFDYSREDGKIRSGVFGPGTILWGIQFAYPRLFQDESLQVLSVREEPRFPNTRLFKQLQRWMRVHTIAAPFEIDGKRLNAPIRLGKRCLSWIHAHPQLGSKGISIKATVHKVEAKEGRAS